jgi:exodeoxyribonuclease V beta subunit
VQTQRDEEVYFEDEPFNSAFENDRLDKSQLRFTLEKGASAGNLLHDLLEHNDFSAPEWEETGSELVTRFGLEQRSTPQLYEWLDEVLQTPLYPNMLFSMSDLPLDKTLREAEFYFPMNDSRWQGLRSVLKAHRQDVAQILDAEAQDTPQLLTPSLQGMMHGYIDLIFEHEGKYYVADYKSTWLGDTVESYSPSALFENNQHHLYDLQYLIYCLALHRYLKQSLPNYSATEHFGGVYYLYLRGMHPENEKGEGVFYSPITPNILNALDSVFSTNDFNNKEAEETAESVNTSEQEEKQPADKLASPSSESGQQQLLFDDEWE